MKFNFKISEYSSYFNCIKRYSQEFENSSKNYNSQRLRFAAGTGDDPKDWYIVYSDPKSNLIQHAAYIVTAGKTLEKAEANPHAISYSDYQNVNGVPVAHSWKYVDWSKRDGIGKTNGEAKISNIRFSKLDENFFTVPEGFIVN